MSQEPSEYELLKLRMAILEKELELEKLKGSNRTQLSAEQLREYNEPSPIVSSGVPKRYITKEQLEALSPAELFILAREKGIAIEHIFPV